MRLLALKHNEFKVLHALTTTGDRLTQRDLASLCDLSLGSVNAAFGSCEQAGYIEDGRISPAGVEALDPYKVDNAVIMAAGLSSRFAPISYEKPKGVLKVRGQVLIERQIQQLLQAGIEDITVVVGYKKEYFFYLAQKYNVKIVVNSNYASRNNNESLWLVRDKLKNTYICSSDDYFCENPFQRYVYKAYYACVYAEGETDEWCITTGANNRIVDVVVGGRDSWIMLGHVYFDHEFSDKFKKILEAEYPKLETADKLWEQIYIDHIKELDMVCRHYDDGIIYEFDSLDELRGFDPMFMRNVDTDIFKNICATLDCEVDDICGFYPLKQGLTNLSCHFRVGDKEYVYRHPGVGTEKLIDRKSEKEALVFAGQLGLDDTFLYMNEDEGWKISRFIEDAKTLDPDNDVQLKQAMEMCRRLHQSDATLGRSFDFVEEGLRYEELICQIAPIEIPGYDELKEKILRLKAYTDADDFSSCISHNDFFKLNFLIDREDKINLIDWEYAGMSDEANDFGTFVVCCQLDEARANKALAYYFGHTPTPEQKRHYWAYVVFAGWCWYVWSLEKEAEGENVDQWLYIYYTYAANYIDDVLASYEK